MRRYVQTERKQPTLPKKKVKRAKRPSNTLSSDDILLLPEHLRNQIDPPKPKPVKKVKPVKTDCVEPVFINARTPGSKILNHRRQPKYPLYTFEDRLNRVYVLDRYNDHFTYQDIKCELVVWTYRKDDPDAEDVNVHLIDRDAEPEEVKTSQLIMIKLVSEHDTSYLIDTPAGRVCPKCKTNEYIKSDLKNMPINYQDRLWRYRDSFGEHCVCCQTNSR